LKEILLRPVGVAFIMRCSCEIHGVVMGESTKAIKTDILCSNGVIHVMDSVILSK
jgi:uncharacterized surface protein with fasciclin (FAS1) repeats